MGYEYVVILGENEAIKETVSLKILSSGQQKEIPLTGTDELFGAMK